MKKVLFVSLITCSIMLLLPLLIVKNGFSSVPVTALQNKIEADLKTELYSTSFKVFNSKDETVTKIKVEDYIFGVVAAEMPALYEEEALKAQAIAAYTFALNRKAENSEKPYDITDNPSTDQSFITMEQAAEKWGSKSEEYTQKLESIIASVKDYIILYNKKPINAVYHAISSGKTEDSYNVWGISLPYLKSVSSEGDKLANGYLTQTEFSFDELKEKFADTTELEDTKQALIKDLIRTDSGTVKKLTIGSKELTGTRIRSILDLRSSNFEFKFSDGKYIFTTFGYGHGVGMSQNGANFMAKQGATFKEILTHYYTDCKIERHSSKNE